MRFRIGSGKAPPSFLYSLPQFEKDAGNDFRVGLGIPRRFGALPVPLQPAPGVGEGAVLLGETGGRESDDFGLDFRGIHVVIFAVVLPKTRGFRGQGVDNHQVFQLGQCPDQLGLVGDRRQGVEPLAEVAVHFALVHQFELPQDVVLHIQLGQPVKAPVVLLDRAVAPPGLHQADVELGIVRPVVELVRPQGLRRALVEVGAVVGLLFVGKRQVARQQVGQEAEVGEPLNVGVASEGVDAASSHADVAQQELHQRRAADHLGAHRMLGPPQGVHEGGGTVGHGGRGEYLADPKELVLWRAADVVHHLRGIAGIVLLHQVEHTARILKSLVDLGVAVRPHLVGPGAAVVLPFIFIVARKQAVLERVALVHDQGGVGVSFDVLVLYLVVTQQVVDHSAQEGDVRAGANRRIEVRHRCRAGEAGVDYDKLGVVVSLGLGDPFEAAGVGLGGIAAHDNDDVGIFDVNPVVGHRAATERRGQTGHRWSVSDARLVVEAQ